ncbi:MAG: hypothetical protein JNL58_11490 [Planctomyces sp.]|nr:hypothetical protein [Planctomyces sp.]
MFGFLSPSQPPRAWRQSYARVCQYQRNLFGISSLPFMGYEPAFLYQVISDFEMIDRLPDNSVTCCRLRKLQSSLQSDRAHGEFAAMFGLFLAGVKLRDDLIDSNRWFNHLLWWKFRRQVRLAEQLLDAGSPGLVSRVVSCIDRYAVFENQIPAPPLIQLVVPAGDGFFEVFSAAARLTAGTTTEPTRDDSCNTIAAIGRHVGQAIIAWDCAVDFEDDCLQKQFTPLNSHSDVQSAFDMCQRELAIAAKLCPDGSPSRQVINSVLHKVAARQRRPAGASCVSVLERWGMLRQRGHTYARCEPICSICCCEVAEIVTCCLSSAEPGCCGNRYDSGSTGKTNVSSTDDSAVK